MAPREMMCFLEAGPNESRVCVCVCDRCYQHYWPQETDVPEVSINTIAREAIP